MQVLFATQSTGSVTIMENKFNYGDYLQARPTTYVSKSATRRV